MTIVTKSIAWLILSVFYRFVLAFLKLKTLVISLLRNCIFKYCRIMSMVAISYAVRYLCYISVAKYTKGFVSPWTCLSGVTGLEWPDLAESLIYLYLTQNITTALVHYRIRRFVSITDREKVKLYFTVSNNNVTETIPMDLSGSRSKPFCVFSDF